jgi:hypothetical protein
LPLRWLVLIAVVEQVSPVKLLNESVPTNALPAVRLGVMVGGVPPYVNEPLLAVMPNAAAFTFTVPGV